MDAICFYKTFQFLWYLKKILWSGTAQIVHTRKKSVQVANLPGAACLPLFTYHLIVLLHELMDSPPFVLPSCWGIDVRSGRSLIDWQHERGGYPNLCDVLSFLHLTNSIDVSFVWTNLTQILIGLSCKPNLETYPDVPDGSGAVTERLPFSICLNERNN